MKIKNKYFYFFLLVIIFFFSFQNIYKKKCKGTYLKSIDTSKFNKKLKNPPVWMDDQIQNDLKDFKNLKINQIALEKTYQTILKNAPLFQEQFIRFRVIDNKIYKYFSSEEKYSKNETSFEKALRSLTKIIKLPYLDFLYSDQDGTYVFLEKNFYLTENENFQAPLLSRAKKKNLDFVLLIPDYHCLSSDWKRDVKTILSVNKKNRWEDKKNIAFFRGAPHKPQRFLLCKLSNENPNILNAGMGKDCPFQEYIKEYTPMIDHLKYKYLPVMDGFMCTYSGYQWRLLSNSVAFKQESDEVQWFYSALKPYEHYVPIKDDMSDVVDQINWAIKNDDKCKKIAENATEFILKNLLIEDVYVYLYKVLIGYSKHQNFSKKDLLNDLKKDKNWICIQNRKNAQKIEKKRSF